MIILNHFRVVIFHHHYYHHRYNQQQQQPTVMEHRRLRAEKSRSTLGVALAIKSSWVRLPIASLSSGYNQRRRVLKK